MNRGSPGLRLTLVGGLFTMSGFTALLIEQVFEKLLSTVVGASTPASAIVLAVYFAGLSLGSASYALLRRTLRQPLLLYGVLEALVGAWALLLALFFSPIQTFSMQIVHLAGSLAWRVFLLRLTVASLWILPSAVAIGMTFPAMVGFLRQISAPQLPRLMARFYALNLLGAVLGAVAGPYLFFPRVGLIGGLLVILLVQLVVASGGVAIALAVRRQGYSLDSEETTQRPSHAGSRTDHRRWSAHSVLLALAFVSGFIFFGFEVIWTHLIGTVLGTSTYAFANMLTAVLAGLFLGALFSSVLFRRHGPTPTWLLPGTMLISMALLAWTFSGWNDVPNQILRWGSELTHFAQGEVLRLVLMMGLIGSPAIALGLIYPLLFRSPLFPVARADLMAAFLGASNALGSILGALVTGFILLPALGSESVYRSFLLILAPMALLLILFEIVWWDPEHRPSSRRPLLGSMLVLTLLVVHLSSRSPSWEPITLTSGVNVYFRPGPVGNRSRLLFWHEDIFGGFTTVIETPTESGFHRRTLLTNGKFQGDDASEMLAQTGFALIPIVHQPRRERGLAIGLGTGHTAAIIGSSGFSHVDIAEISPGIVEATQRFFGHLNHGVLEWDNVRLHLEDGRNVLLRGVGDYDLISIELTSIWFAGATNLYSREFYELARERLKPDGVLQQWIQLHHIAPEEVASAIATLQSVFDYVSVWQLGGQGILVASPRALRIENSVLQELSKRQELEPYIKLLRLFGTDLYDLRRHRVLSQHEVPHLTEFVRREGIPLNTDGNRFLEYATPRHNLERKDHHEEVLQFLLSFRSP